MIIFSAQNRKVLDLVLQGKISKTDASARLGVSRKTVYSWLADYRTLRSRLDVKGVKRSPKKEDLYQKDIEKILLQHHRFGPRRIARVIAARGGQISERSVWEYLRKKGLQEKEAREAYASSFRQPRQKDWRSYYGSPRLTNEARKRMVEEVVLSGRRAGEVAREYGISRKTIAKWKQRYLMAQQRGQDILRFLSDQHPIGAEHPRGASDREIRLVLNLVVLEPHLSSEKISQKLGVIGNHGVQRILERFGINTYAHRLAYAKSRKSIVPILLVTSWLRRLTLVFEELLPSRALAPPPVRKPSLRAIRLSEPEAGPEAPPFAKAPIGERPPFFKQLRRPSIQLLFSLVIFVLLFRWGWFLAQAQDLEQFIGWTFASIALAMGSVFFLYSMKYYFTLAVVLSFSREADSDQRGPFHSERSDLSKEVGPLHADLLKPGSFLGRLFGVSPPTSDVVNSFTSDVSVSGQAGGLEPDLTQVALERYPMISVHIPIYNEQRVAERVLRACTGFDYPNYEVVVVDDSTNKTTAIVEKYLQAHGTTQELTGEHGKRILKFRPSTPDAPSITLIHRDTREGFKGGALRQALSVSDPRAEFIVVFDADFVPYPDTLELFLKYFQVNAGTLRSSARFKIQDLRFKNTEQDKNYQQSNVAAVQGYQSFDSLSLAQDKVAYGGSKIAAIQGYQWPFDSSLDQSRDFAQGKHVYGYQDSKVAAVQGYQWHVLNKSENWITRGVRSEYAGSYVIERSGAELYGGLKQIAGSVYMIRRDLLETFGWGTSLTEDFELTLRLYAQGYRVVYTPYIQAPAECASTLKRLIRQRMRWAEGHSFNIRRMFARLLFGGWVTGEVENAKLKAQNAKLQLKTQSSIQENNRTVEQYNNSSFQKQGMVWLPSPLSLSEKLEFLYLSPYYLQAAFFLLGTLSWLISETIFKARLPFWTNVWGWSLVLTNLLSLPLMNSVGLFLEEAEERDYGGILSFVLLSYLLTPFQAYAAIKGFLEEQEGPWFRTPKTGRITDIITRGRFYRFVRGIFPRLRPFDYAQGYGGQAGRRSRIFREAGFSLAFNLPVNVPDVAHLPRRVKHWIGNATLTVVLLIAVLVSRAAGLIELVSAQSYEPAVNTVMSSTQQEDRQFPDEPMPLDRPVIYTYQTKDGLGEQIFHPEPRVRVKSAGRELELVTVGSVGLGTPSHNGATSAGHQVTYEGIFEGVDLRYSSNAGRLVEEFILREYQEVQVIESLIRMVDVIPRQTGGTIEFVDERTGESVFVLPPPYLYEQPEGAEGHPLRFESLATSGVEYSLGIEYEMHRTPLGWKLTKRLTESGKQWLADPERRFPVVIDPSVIVSGGITDAEVQFGALQRKVAFMPNASVGAAWYAFYQSGGDILYKRCLASSNCDQASDWSAAQDILTTDADNYNPAIWVKGDVIWVAWIDDGAEAIEFNSINTASSDATGTQCASANLGTIDSSNMVSIAVQETGTNIYVAQSDTSTDTEVHIFEVTSACSFTDRTSGSGLTAGDRPVVVYDGDSGKRDDVLVVFQDGNLSYSIWNSTTGIWAGSNVTIAAVTDSTYAVVSDGTSAWVLTQSGTTATNFYRIGGIESTLDASVGGNRAFLDIDCPASGDCKMVYSDAAAATTDITFVDCNNTSCSAPVTRSLDSNVGRGPHYGTPVAIDCVSATDCKIVYYSLSSDDIFFIDCNDADCGTRTSQILDTGTGREMPSYVDLYCVSSTDCKVTYIESGLNDLKFVDCADTDCNPLTAGYSNIAIDTEVGEIGGISSLYCPTSGDCKVVYYDSSTTNGSIFFTDCADSPCTLASNTYTEVDANVGIGDTRFSAVDCTAGASECRFVYYDGTDQDVTFVDCNASATCNPGAGRIITDIDLDVGAVGSPVAMECNNNAGSPDDCKIFYYDGTDQDVTFVDCNNDSCSSSTINDIDSAVGADSAYLSLDCILVSDCQLLYLDGAEMDITLVDCEDGDCSNPTSFTDIDTTVESEQPWVSIDCPAVDNCKIVYHDISEGDMTFVDCNDTACTAPGFSDIDTDVGRMGAPSSINCPASNDCKVVYFSYIAKASKFADCNDEACSAPTVNTLDTTVEDHTSRSAIDCPTAADCKIVYHDTPGSDITYVDCNDGACSAPSTVVLDTAVETYPSGVDIDCSLGATDCRIVFFDGADEDVTYVDCDGGVTTACDTNTQTDVDLAVGTRAVDLSAQIDCAGGTDDCKILYHDNIDGDVTFIDCSVAATCCVNAGCTGVGETATVTDIDAAVGGDNNRFVLNLTMDCVSAGNCKLVYYDKTDAVFYFVDCDSADCSSNTSRPLTTTPGTAGGPIAMDCGSDDTDCKIVYSDTNEGSIKFIDCLGATCVENSLTAPWTSETNVLGVSLTLDSTNSRLYAHIIKDASEQAYFKDSAKDSISWGGQSSYGFTTGDLNHISSPMSGAGPTQIGVVLRQNSNYEFSAVPETWQTILASGLLVVGWLKRKELKARFRRRCWFRR